MKAREAVETCHARCDEFSRAGEENRKRRKRREKRIHPGIIVY